MFLSFKQRLLVAIILQLGELNQSLMYSRLQSRLNPVPESLNSPGWFIFKVLNPC